MASSVGFPWTGCRNSKRGPRHGLKMRKGHKKGSRVGFGCGQKKHRFSPREAPNVKEEEEGTRTRKGNLAQLRGEKNSGVEENFNQMLKDHRRRVKIRGGKTAQRGTSRHRESPRERSRRGRLGGRLGFGKERGQDQRSTKKSL